MSGMPARSEETPLLDHPAFVAAWRTGEIEVAIDHRRAASLMSSRLLLPFVAMPVIGLVLLGWLRTGMAIGAVGILVPKLIKRSAAGMVIQHVEHDPDLYRAAVRCGAIVWRRTAAAR